VPFGKDDVDLAMVGGVDQQPLDAPDAAVGGMHLITTLQFHLAHGYAIRKNGSGRTGVAEAHATARDSKSRLTASP
jgi:hypothetical protein